MSLRPGEARSGRPVRVERPGLLLTPRQGFLLARALEVLRRQAARDGTSVLAELVELHEDLSWLSATYLDEGRLRPASDVDVSASVPRGGGRAEWGREDDMVTTGEAAELLGCSAHNVRDLVRRGSLPAHRRGRSVWVPLGEVLALRDARAAG